MRVHRQQLEQQETARHSGLHEGSVLSLLLFVIVMEMISRGLRAGLPLELLYADDLILMAESEESLHDTIVNWPSKSYVTPPRWRGLGNWSTPVSHHIVTRLRKVDENVDAAKFRRLCSTFPHSGFGVPCWWGWVGPCLRSAMLVSWFMRLVSMQIRRRQGSVWPSEPSIWGY